LNAQSLTGQIVTVLDDSGAETEFFVQFVWNDMDMWYAALATNSDDDEPLFFQCTAGEHVEFLPIDDDVWDDVAEAYDTWRFDTLHGQKGK